VQTCTTRRVDRTMTTDTSARFVCPGDQPTNGEGDQDHPLTTKVTRAATATTTPTRRSTGSVRTSLHARYHVALQAALATGPGTVSTAGFASAVNAFLAE
jgi:hypothetical protein